MKILAETPRLLLREIALTDVGGMFALDSDPEVHRYLGNKPVTTKEQALEVIHFIRQQYLDNGIGRWAILDKETNEFIGWTGLKFERNMTNHHINYYDLGYRLRKEYWGKGIATEAALASLNHAFNVLQLEEVFAMADCENQGSNHLLKKVGMKLIEVFKLDGIPTNWYRISKAAYEAGIPSN